MDGNQNAVAERAGLIQSGRPAGVTVVFLEDSSCIAALW
jgi:hypothetical protein